MSYCSAYFEFDGSQFTLKAEYLEGGSDDDDDGADLETPTPETEEDRRRRLSAGSPYGTTAPFTQPRPQALVDVFDLGSG
jgi:hypothetical protein